MWPDVSARRARRGARTQPKDPGLSSVVILIRARIPPLFVRLCNLAQAIGEGLAVLHAHHHLAHRPSHFLHALCHCRRRAESGLCCDRCWSAALCRVREDVREGVEQRVQKRGAGPVVPTTLPPVSMHSTNRRHTSLPKMHQVSLAEVGRPATKAPHENGENTTEKGN